MVGGGCRGGFLRLLDSFFLPPPFCSALCKGDVSGIWLVPSREKCRTPSPPLFMVVDTAGGAVVFRLRDPAARPPFLCPQFPFFIGSPLFSDGIFVKLVSSSSIVFRMGIF